MADSSQARGIHALQAARRRLLAALCALWVGVLSAGAGDLAPGFSFQSWQVEEGLPQNSVLSIAQTPEGYLWVATFNGLARFDGVRFTPFDTSNVRGLPVNRLVSLFVDRAGALWVITEQSHLLQLRTGACQNFSVGDGLPDEGVRWVGEDARGTLWVGGAKHGLWRRDGNRFLAVAEPEGLAGTEYRAMLTDGAGRLWLVHASGVFGWDEGRWVKLPAPNDQPNTGPNAVGASRDGGLWVLWAGGLRKWQAGQWRQEAWPELECKSPIRDMKEDLAGNLWVATYSEGLLRFTPAEGWQKFTTESGLTTVSLRSLLCDREGNVWVGTDGGGLLRVTSRPWRMITRREGLGIDAVHSVCEDRDGRIWFAGGTAQPYLLDRGRVTAAITPPRNEGMEGVWSVLQAHDGAMWIGTYWGKAFRYQDGGPTVFGRPQGLLAGSVRAMLEDRQGRLWVGGFEGLSRIESGRVTHYGRQDGLTSEKVWALAEAADGTLFIGTAGGGLNALKDGRFTAFSRAQGLPDDHIRSLLPDASGALWIGTRAGGLSRYQEGRCFNFAVRGGLPARSIGPMLEDDAGCLWMISSAGILRVSRRELEDFARGVRGDVRFASFDRSDGLATIDASGIQPACLKASDGKLWFGTAKGAACVTPADLRTNPLPPSVLIEEVRVDDQLVASDASPQLPPVASSLTLAPRQQRVEFRFTALSFRAPTKVRFRYRLEGLEHDWVDGGSARSVAYLRPPPGRYQFQVTASNSDGVWNETGASLTLQVLPPWWQTWWFRSGVGLVAAGAVFGFYEWRIWLLHRRRAMQQEFSRRLIASQEEERKRIASELHDSLGQNLLVIKNLAALGGRAGENETAKTDKLATISTLASQAIGEVRGIARALRPFELDRLGLTKALTWLVKPASESSGIQFELALAEVDGLFPPEFEINLYRVVQEAVANILKHSRATVVRLQLTREGPQVRLLIQDNGCGFQPVAAPPPAVGMGLTDMAERVRIMGGQFAIESAPGAGTQLRVVLPLPAPADQPTRGTE